MPKAKPSSVQVLRIEFNTKEREMLEQALAVYSVEKSAESINDLLSFQNLYIGITIYEMMTGKEILYGTPNDLNDLIDAVKTWWGREKDEYPEGQAMHQSFAMWVKNILVQLTGWGEVDPNNPYTQYYEAVWGEDDPAIDPGLQP
jgi:hypothetical protein|tara:strand:+ start:116 stop:550 length:435 start_codon:yes stop_codon:yes gene_type:complete